MTELSPQDCAKGIEAALAEVFATAERIAERVEAIWTDTPGGVSVRQLEALQPVIFTEIDAHAHYTGAGFLVEPGALSDADRYLEWWERNGSDAHRRLVLDLDPHAPECYDYVSMDWYVGAKAGLNSVRGPYLDYAGADRFVFTFATPVTVDGQFVGASGVDVLVAAFDPLLFDRIRCGAAPLALMDRDRRVIVSNHPDVAPSERLRTHTVEEAIPIGGDGVGWRLCTLR